jgi:O-antigen ligase
MTDTFALLKIVVILCVPVVLFAPRRLALCVWMVISNLDVSAADWQVRDSVGWENTIRILVIPVILFVRYFAQQPLIDSLRSRAFRVWLAFSAYVVLAALWTPYGVSALKMAGYMLSHVITFIVFYTAWARGSLSQREITLTIVASFVIGIIQTYYCDHVITVNMGEDMTRFSTFVQPQGYAFFLCGMLILVLLGRGFGRARQAVLSALIVAQMFLCGSRTYLVAAVVSLAIAFFGYVMQNLSIRRTKVALLATNVALIALLLVVALLLLAPDLAGSSRSLQAVALFAQGRSLSEIGTYGFRLAVWDATWDELPRSTSLQAVFGHGTSSAIDILRTLGHYVNETVFDGNRIFHNEYLRALYEWGVVGTFLLLAVLVLVFVHSMASVFRNRRTGYLGLCATVLMVVAFSTENVLASSGWPGGIAMLLILSQVAQGARLQVG